MGEFPQNFVSEVQNNYVKHPPLDIASAADKPIKQRGSLHLGLPSLKLYTTEFQDEYREKDAEGAKGELNLA